MADSPRILYCHCAYAKVVPDEVKHEVLARLAESGEAFEAVADLCEMSARRDPALRGLVEDRPVRVAACFPRAVRWLFHAAGAPLPDAGVDVCNMRTADAGQVVRMLLGGEPIPRAEPPVESPVGQPQPQEVGA